MVQVPMEKLHTRKDPCMSNDHRPSRRAFLQTGLVGASAAVLGPEASSASAGEPKEKGPKVRYAELPPHEFRERLAKQPIAYLPLGTLEWHGEHLALGADAIQSEGLMIECARRFGGIVMPPIYLGPDSAQLTDDGKMLIGMDRHQSVNPPHQLDGSCYWVPMGFHLLMVDAILTQLKRAGFKAVFADGHGPSRWSWCELRAERESRFGLKLFGVTGGIAGQWKSQVDHAARNETSLMMHLRPDLVELSRLPESRASWNCGWRPRSAKTRSCAG